MQKKLSINNKRTTGREDSTQAETRKRDCEAKLDDTEEIEDIDNSVVKTRSFSKW